MYSPVETPMAMGVPQVDLFWMTWNTPRNCASCTNLPKSSSVHSVHPLCEDVCRGTASEVAFGAGSSKDIAKCKEASKEERRELYEL